MAARSDDEATLRRLLAEDPELVNCKGEVRAQAPPWAERPARPAASVSLSVSVCLWRSEAGSHCMQASPAGGRAWRARGHRGFSQWACFGQG